MGFDKDAFMQATIKTALSTKVKPVPVGEYIAQIVEVDARGGIIGKGEKAGNPWGTMDVTWEIQDPALAAEMNRERVRVRQGLMLDLTPEGMLDLGPERNVRYGKLRDAVGMNNPDKEFNPQMLVGQTARIQVTQRPDDADPSIIYNDVSRVAKL